ncbi:unnamed protein product [Calicophoron daubneyi]|uniref:IMD domain-containing protein n=1 Tax=Calicophoron daubneyi TaxID=300641 RepID=A0AAV2TUW1_CALDB
MIQDMGSGEILTISNNLLSELKNSYPIWDDLVAKTGKFHTSLKLTIQTATAFLDAIQKVADLASRTCGGSREIGACLTRLCLRQRRLETKLKTMSNHLITSLANPLSLKIDEWRRTLNQLEKDRARQTKKARAELKRAVSEASRWQKKAAKCGTSGTDLGPGVGHGILPSTNGTKASAIAAQSSQAARDVKVKTELLENAERSAVRSFMLEERSRFCFFLSCLLPFLEFESSMLSEISAIDELLHSLSKAAEKPNQLMEDAESVLYAAARGDVAALLRRGDMRSSLYPHESENSSSLIAAATAALFASNDRTQGGSSDTDSGRLTMEANGTERKADDPSDNCSLSSSTQFQLHVGSGVNNVRCGSICDGTGSSIGGVSSHSSGSGSNHGYGTSSISSGALGASRPADRPSYNSNNDPSSPHLARLDPTGGLGSHHSSINSVNIMSSVPGGVTRISSADDAHVHPDSSSYQAEVDDTQFQTLCRPRHCRTVSVGGSTTVSSAAKGGTNGVLPGVHPGSASTRSDSTSEANLSLNLICFQSEHGPVTVDPEWLRQCDDDEEEEDDDGDEDYEENPGSGRPNTDEDGGDYVQVTEKAKVPVSAEQRVGARANAMVGRSGLFDGVSANADVIANGLTSGRHTISSAYEHGPSASRPVISNTTFSPPIAKSSSKDSGVDSSTVLYPNQAVPPPVYTNLNQLAHAAQRKFSIPQLLPSVGGIGSHLADVGEVSKRDSDTHSLKRMMTCPPSNVSDSPSRTQGEDRPPAVDGTSSVGLSARPQKHQSVMELSNIGTTQQSPLPVSQSIASQLASANRRGTIATTDPAVRPNSNGIDPFSVEMDELDKLGAGLESFGISSNSRYNSLPKMSSKRGPVGVSPLAMTASLHEQASESDTSDTSTGLTLFSSDSRATLLSFSPSSNTSNNRKTSADQKRTASVDYLVSVAGEFPSTSSFVVELKHRVSICSESPRVAKYLQRNDRQTSTPTPALNRPSIPPPVSPKPFHLREALAMHRIHSFRQFPHRPPPLPVRCSSCQGSTNSLNVIEPPSRSQIAHTAGSSCASSLTMASSTTSESQPSTNGALGGNKKPANSRSLSSQFGDMSPQEPCQPRQEVNSDIYKSANFARNCHSVYQNIRGPEMSGPGGSPARPVSSVCQLDGELPPPPPAAAQWTTASCANRNPAASSLEAAHLMSELSSQLQQLAKRTNEDSIPNYSSPSVNKYNQSVEQTSDGFDLPPPPPPSMFGANSGSADQGPKGGNVDNSQDALLSALKRTIEMREARFSSARDHSAPPRPK